MINLARNAKSNREIKITDRDTIHSRDFNNFFYGTSTEIEVVADAWDINGSIIRVEFFADGIKIGEDTDGSDGWKINWTEHSVGEYFLTAKATDNGGVSTTSEKVIIWIVPVPQNSNN